MNEILLCGTWNRLTLSSAAGGADAGSGKAQAGTANEVLVTRGAFGCAANPAQPGARATMNGIADNRKRDMSLGLEVWWSATGDVTTVESSAMPVLHSAFPDRFAARQSLHALHQHGFWAPCR